MQTKEGREMIDRKVLTAEEARKQRDHQGVAVELERDVLGFIANPSPSDRKRDRAFWSQHGERGRGRHERADAGSA